MSVSLRSRAIPQCSACLWSCSWISTPETAPSSALRQQIRGKKNVRLSGTVAVKLLKDLPGFGKRGAIVPASAGEMRNKWFPRRFADYIPQAELKSLKANNVPIERDYSFARQTSPVASSNLDSSPSNSMFDEPIIEPPKPKAVEKLTSERSMQLLEIFVRPVLEFYRQPILEEKVEDPVSISAPKKQRPRTASSAAADLLAARLQVLPEKEKANPTGPQAIYGSVSLHDILAHIRAAIAMNDEAARVILIEDDIRFMDMEQQAEGKAKTLGDFTIEITVKGHDTGLKRIVRVKPQDA